MKSRTETNEYRLSGWKRVVRSRWGVMIALVAVLVPLAIYAAEAGSSDSDGDGFLEFVANTVIDPDEMNANFDVVADHIGTYEGAISVDEETGNVGIGTTGPEAKLTVNGSIALARGSDMAQALGFYSVSHELVIENGGNHPDSDIVFGTAGTGQLGSGSETMTITNAGNVGIGTTSPLSRLAVAGLPSSPPSGDTSGARGIVCITNAGNMWVDDDGLYDCQ